MVILSWKVGVLFSKTGVTSVIEKTQLNATLLAIREINSNGGVNGRFIKPIVYDPQSNPENFRKLAKRLITKDSANIIFGCYMSSTRKAVLPIVENHNGLLWYPTLYEGFEYSKNVIYTGAVPNQNSMFLARYLMNQYGNRFYFVGSNYIYPYETNRIMKDILQSKGGKVVAEKYLPLDATKRDIDPILVDILEKRPNVIFSTIVGSATSKFYKSYWNAGLQPSQMPIASLTTSEAEVTAMGKEVGVGHVTASPYFETVKTPSNYEFVKKYKAMFGTSSCTNACAEAAYFQVHLFANVLRRIGTLDTDIVRTATIGTIFDAPQGTIQIDPDNNHTYLWPKIARVNELGKFEIVAETDVPVKPDPYLVDLGSDKSLSRMKYFESDILKAS
ncbi:MAG: transporter substrate-binding domain-containing protein [Gammaproteobacteria bacterium]